MAGIINKKIFYFFISFFKSRPIVEMSKLFFFRNNYILTAINAINIPPNFLLSIYTIHHTLIG